MAYRPHHADLHRLRGAAGELWGEFALSAAGAPPESQEVNEPDRVPPGARSHRSNRISLLTAGLSVYDPGPDHRLGGRDYRTEHRASRFSRSQDSALGADVGRLHGDGLHPLELRMARAPRRVPGNVRLRGRAGRLGGKLFLGNAQVRDLMRYQLIGLNHKSAPLEVRERLAI